MWENQEKYEDGAHDEAVLVPDGGGDDGGEGYDHIEHAQNDQGHREGVEPAGEEVEAGHVVLVDQVEGEGDHQDSEEDQEAIDHHGPYLRLGDTHPPQTFVLKTKTIYSLC